MKKQVHSISAGLAFMRAAVHAMPRSLGDRERVAAMDAAMTLAVKNRFAFDKEDAEQLENMGIHRCVGVFRALDFYLLACRFGGTYPRMWEAHHGQKPWMADRAVFPAFIGGADIRQPVIIENNRIAVGAGALLPGMDDPDLATYEKNQVWWCTSMTEDSITVCRYKVTDASRKYHGLGYAPLHHEGKPTRVRKLTRTQWEDWNKQAAEQRTVSLAA